MTTPKHATRHPRTARWLIVAAVLGLTVGIVMAAFVVVDLLWSVAS